MTSSSMIIFTPKKTWKSLKKPKRTTIEKQLRKSNQRLYRLSALTGLGGTPKFYQRKFIKAAKVTKRVIDYQKEMNNLIASLSPYWYKRKQRLNHERFCKYLSQFQTHHEDQIIDTKNIMKKQRLMQDCIDISGVMYLKIQNEKYLFCKMRDAEESIFYLYSNDY